MVNFENIVHDWFNMKKKLLKPSSISAYHTVVIKALLPYFKDKEINNNTVQDYVLLCTYKGYAKITVTDHLKILTAILKHGEFLGLCESKIFDVDFPTILNFRKRDSVAFSVRDIKKLQKFLLNNSKENTNNLAILTSLFLGLRIGETIALKFSDFDFKNKNVFIQRTISRTLELDETNAVLKTVLTSGTTKTKSSTRKIPVSDSLLNLIKIHLEGKKISDCVFPSKKSKGVIDSRTLRAYYFNVLNNLEIPNIPYHSLRHSFASNCIASGVDIKTTSALLGHADIKMTLEVYTHPTFEQKKIAISKLGKLFSYGK